MRLPCLIAISCVLITSPHAVAAPAATKSAVQPAAPLNPRGSSQACEPIAPTKVEKVAALRWSEVGTATSDTKAGLGDWVSLHVCNLDTLIKNAGSKPIALYIDGLELPGIEPIFLRREGQVTILHFHLQRTDKSGPHWAELMGKPDAWLRDVQVSVGPSGCGPDCNDMAVPAQFSLVLFRPWGLASFFLLLLLVIVLFWKYGKMDMLRDAAFIPPEAPPGALPVGPRPFSLGRCQMAFWFLLTVAAFFFIWTITGDLASLTPSVLTLIGISASTALGAVAIDASKRTADQNQLTQMASDQNRLQASLASLQAAPAMLAAAGPVAAAPAVAQIHLQIAATQARMADLNAKREAWRSTPPKQPKGFFFDILSDGNGVSFHRLQIVIWTLILAAVFVISVAVSLEMPTFDNTLLALMGISSGTYLGFKFPENQV